MCGRLVSVVDVEGNSPGIYAGGDDGPGSSMCVGGGRAEGVESSGVSVSCKDIRLDEVVSGPRLRMVDIDVDRDNAGPSCSETADE